MYFILHDLVTPLGQHLHELPIGSIFMNSYYGCHLFEAKDFSKQFKTFQFGKNEGYVVEVEILDQYQYTTDSSDVVVHKLKKLHTHYLDNVSTFCYFLQCDQDYQNYTTDIDSSFIEWICHENYLDLVKFFYDRNIFPTVIEKYSNQCFGLTVSKNYLQLTSYLIDIGLKYNNNIIEKSIMYRDIQHFKLFMENKSNANLEKLLIIAVRYSQTEMIKILIDCGTNVSNISPNDLVNEAIVCGNYHTVVQILSLIDVSQFVEKENANPICLMFASNIGSLEIIKLLVEIGVDPRIKCCNNSLIFENAINHRSKGISIIKYLIECGLDYQDRLNNCLIRALNFNYNSQEIQELIKLGVDIDYSNGYCLYYAVDAYKPDIVKLLVEHGADITINDNRAIKTAIENGFFDIAKYLRDNGATYYPADKDLDEVGEFYIWSSYDTS